jgi:hypothetical protein
MEIKPIEISQHALERLPQRGITQKEVEIAIRQGERIPAESGRFAFRKNFPFESKWKNRYYEIKQVMPIVVEEGDKLVVVTVYAFYIGG